MEKEDYKFKVTNIKISVKLLQPASLNCVEDRCRLLQPIHRNISWRRCGNNILTLRYNNFTYILFKKSSKLADVASCFDRPQHCNITKIKSESDIPEAIGHLFFLVNQTPTWLDYTIDNYSCLANTNQLIDIVEIYMNELTVRCDYNEQLFPALKIYSPKEISERNLTSLVYKSGSVILVGGNNLDEVKEFFNWVLKITQKYPKL